MASRGQGEARGRMGNLLEDYPPLKDFTYNFKRPNDIMELRARVPRFVSSPCSRLSMWSKVGPLPRGVPLLLFLPLVMLEVK